MGFSDDIESDIFRINPRASEGAKNKSGTN